MKNKKIIIISSILLVAIAITTVLALVLFKKEKITYMTPPTINGVALGEYTIVYDEQGLDYNKRAAEYIKNTSKQRYGVDLPIVDDNSSPKAHEIVVGETSRSISAVLDEETTGVEFSILAKDGSIALEGDYFVIAAAAFYFMETHALTDAQTSEISETAAVLQPITKEAKNFILLIGDGMGVYHTKSFEYMTNNVDYSDGENIFYGYMLPYIGESRTNSLSGTTDSAAGGTALSSGHKTFNGYVGLDRAQNPIKNITELANELGMSAGVMSTETQTGATPSSFLAHVVSRDFTNILIDKIYEAREKYGTVVNCDFDYYTVNYMKLIENKITETLANVSANENGFFLMYEEAHIDKHSHDNDIEKMFQAIVRFNQAIARFMEFAFYNPDTMIVITADHETGKLLPNEEGKLAYNYDDHSSANVLIFAYGKGAEIFNGVNIENIQIAHTIAALMGDENFGDQSEFQSLTKATK